jgi:hypothetical protein
VAEAEKTADLFAAAPETAEERDRLKARLRIGRGGPNIEEFNRKIASMREHDEMKGRHAEKSDAERSNANGYCASLCEDALIDAFGETAKERDRLKEQLATVIKECNDKAIAVAQLNASVGDAMHRAQQAEAERDRLRAENAELLAALKPYVDADFEHPNNTSKADAHNARLTAARAVIATMIEPQPIPEHAEKYVKWRDDGKFGWAYIVVGYCPDELAYFIGLAQELAKDIPEVNPGKVTCSKITVSSTMKGFTIAIARLAIPKREIPGYTERSMDFNY